MNPMIPIGGVFFLVGALFAILGLTFRRRAAASREWPTIQGEVVSSTIERHESSDSDGSTSVSFEPVVEYHYSVMGSPFTGRRIAYGANTFDYRTAEKISASFPAGSKVQVHYNPDKPAEAVLETTARGGNLFTVLGLLFVLIGVVVAVIGLLRGV